MADLFNEKPADTYKSLLNIGTANNQIVDSTLRTIEDGRGNSTALKLSSTKVRVKELVVDTTITGATVDGGSFDGT